MCFQSEANNVTCDDGARIAICKCNACDASMWKFPTCGTTKNAREDRNAANRNKLLCRDLKLNPRLGTNAIDGSAIDECDEENLALNGDFEVNDVERELNQMNFLSDLSLENNNFNCFIKYLDKDLTRKQIISASQDSHFSEIRCSNLCKGDVDLQIQIFQIS